MSMDYIRTHYSVPAKKGMKVIVYGKPGVITGADGQYLRIKLDGAKHSDIFHPTDRIEYPGNINTPITIRCSFTTGAYHARAPGYKATASSAESAQKAADRLIERLRPEAVINRVEAIQDTGSTASNLFHYHFKAEDEV